MLVSVCNSRGQVFEMFFSEEENKALKHTFEAGENYYQVFRFLDYIYQISVDLKSVTSRIQILESKMSRYIKKIVGQMVVLCKISHSGFSQFGKWLTSTSASCRPKVKTFYTFQKTSLDQKVFLWKMNNACSNLNCQGPIKCQCLRVSRYLAIPQLYRLVVEQAL